jgi:CHAT domain-containing protein
LSASEIQWNVLDEGTLLLEYALGETTSYLWVVSPAAVRSYTLAPKAEIEGAARALYERLSAPPGAAGPEREAAALSRLVLGPAAEALGNKRLLVVAPGMLQYVPFGVLPAPGAASGTSAPVALLSRHEVVSAPSASVVALIRREAAGRPVGSRTVAVLADPVYGATDPRVKGKEARIAPGAPATHTAPSVLERALRSMRGSTDGSLSRLPFSRWEADAIAALAPRGDARKALGFEASRETALSSELGHYRIVHLAAHGLLDAKRPELSGVVLSLVDDQGKPKDGYLRLHDVYNMKLGADLVVLSGCQTALGKELGGEGLLGLTRGFMYAGASRVVASLWQVDDESTAELMKRFYRAMLKDGRPASEALRAAQLEMSRDRRWSAPFYWAGFVLQGEWE